MHRSIADDRLIASPGAQAADRIDLAHVADFSIGTLIVLPSTREVMRANGRPEVIEPRVMQVLIALNRAGGMIVSRDDLSDSCWQGRIVGDDAINRVISRLRRVAEGPGGGSFRIETVTKVGYRLVERRGGGGDTDRAATIAKSPSRRTTIAAGIAAAAIGTGGVAWWQARRASASPTPPAVAALMTQGYAAYRQCTSDGLAQAIGIFGRVVELEPDYGRGWSALATAYSLSTEIGPPQMADAMRARTVEAANRALAVDRDDGSARAALIELYPKRGRWLETERAYRDALTKSPANLELLVGLANTMCSAGRIGEAALLFDRAVAANEPSPSLLFGDCLALWAANRMEDADRALQQAYALYPRHFAVWFVRFYILMYTGRVDQAIAQARQTNGWPYGIPDMEIANVQRVAEAVESRRPADVAAVIGESLRRAPAGAGYAENSMQFCCALGDVDDAFAVAGALYFGRGFTVADKRFSTSQGTFTSLRNRHTYTLFLPSTKPMRDDPRFEQLVDDLGLDNYWAQSRSTPDYRKAIA